MDPSTLDQYVEDTAAFLKQYKQTKDNLEQGNKLLKELTISLDILERHLSGIDLSNIKSSIEDTKKAVNFFASQFDKEQSELKEKKRDCYNMLEKIHLVHTMLDGVEKEKVQDEEADPFIVEMGKLLYPNSIDNHQLRGDPPIGSFSASQLCRGMTGMPYHCVEGVFKC